MDKHKGLLLVVSGPSGVGKGTVCKALINRNPDVKLSVSATTRKRRSNEEEGVSYFFKSQEEFDRMIAEGELLEYVKLFNSNYYGTPRDFVNREIKAGNDILLEIDYHGGLSVKKAFPDAVLIFVAPPEMAELKVRLETRNSESADSVNVRLTTALEEISMIEKYEYVVINDGVDRAVMALESIITAEKCRVERNGEMIAALREE